MLSRPVHSMDTGGLGDATAQGFFCAPRPPSPSSPRTFALLE